MPGLVPASRSIAPEHSPTPGCERCSTGRGREEEEENKGKGEKEEGGKEEDEERKEGR